MEYSIELFDQAATPTLSVRRRSALQDLPTVIGPAYAEIMEFAGMQGLEIPGPAFVIYYNMDMQNLDMEIGFVAGKKIKGNESINSSEIKAGKYVTAMHTGPYMEMKPLYEAMISFMNERELLSSGIAIEFYYNSPMEVPENQLKTRVMLGVVVD